MGTNRKYLQDLQDTRTTKLFWFSKACGSLRWEKIVEPELWSKYVLTYFTFDRLEWHRWLIALRTRMGARVLRNCVFSASFSPKMLNATISFALIMKSSILSEGKEFLKRMTLAFCISSSWKEMWE